MRGIGKIHFIKYLCKHSFINKLHSTIHSQIYCLFNIFMACKPHIYLLIFFSSSLQRHPFFSYCHNTNVVSSKESPEGAKCYQLRLSDPHRCGEQDGSCMSDEHHLIYTNIMFYLSDDRI
jgi:hypothetical protein